MTVKRIVLVRHGETSHTVEGRFCGTDDPDLTPAGFAAALALVGHSSLRSVDLILSSPSRRARQTADPVAAHCNRTVELDAAFIETSFGAWEGVKYDEVRGTDAHRAWVENPALWAPPNGETGIAVQGRSVAAIARRLPLADELAIFSHKGTIRLIYSFFTQSPPAHYRRLPDVPPGSVTELWLKDGQVVRSVLGDLSHVLTGTSVETLRLSPTETVPR